MIYRGKPAVTSTVIDITREKTLESQLLQAQKMEAVGTLVGGIAHDFNNILTVFTGYGTLLQMGLDQKHPLRKYADQLLSAAEKAVQLTHGLLAFSRKQAIILKPVKMNSVIKGTEKLLKRLLTDDIELRTNLTSEDTTVMADTMQIDQILFNLTSNARDAMPKGGILTIETKRLELGHEFENIYGYGEPGVYILISISDTGLGMNIETREHIFDPFFTTKEVGRGTGLGLSTIYGIVRQHKGYINVYSEPDMGTIFHIYFPSAYTIAVEEKPAPVTAGTGKETVLIAEDNEAVRGLISTILIEHGYTTIEAIDGPDAIEKFRKADRIDLLIFDSVMPKKNGRETYNEICEMKPDIKAIFTSGYTRDVFLDKGIEDEKFNFLQKPISPSSLLQKVREVLDGRQNSC
jgi:nitrogen-specific signal transduction histidine kinase/CheY-like chemotaxis protein